MTRSALENPWITDTAPIADDQPFARGFDPNAFLDELEQFAAELDDVPLFVVRDRSRAA